MKWLAKAATQGMISLLPQRHAVNYQFQRNLTKSLRLSRAKINRRLEWTTEHLRFYQTYRTGIPASVVELGTGWVPTVPLALALCGVETVYSIDIHDLKRTEILDELLALFYAYPFDALCEVLPYVQAERYKHLLAQRDQPALQVFAAMGIQFVITDARATDFPAASLAFFVSNTTLEHIPGEVIAGIWHEFHRIAQPQALMSHLIDMSDHYSHFDSAITPYHFLQHSPSVWRLLNNALMYQNRLRVSDFRALHAQTGFHILHERNQLMHADKLNTITLAPEFRYYTADDLIPTSSWMIAEPIPSG